MRRGITIWLLAGSCCMAAGCGVSGNENDSRTKTQASGRMQDTSEKRYKRPLSADLPESNDSVCLSSDKSLHESGECNPQPKPTAKELTDLQELVTEKMQQLRRDGNPLGYNWESIGIGKDVVEVSMAINTPRWQNEFRKLVSDSPHIRFEGPSRPERITEIVKSDTILTGIRIAAERRSYPDDADKAAFRLINGSDRNT